MNDWIDNGAKLAWLIDPIEQMVSIYRAGKPVEVLTAPVAVSEEGPIAGFELEMADLEVALPPILRTAVMRACPFICAERRPFQGRS